jgi:carbohydrate-selective porin OprB
VGSDRLIGSLLYRFPLWEIGDLIRLEGHLGTHAANVYANVGDQFSPVVHFGNEGVEGPNRPLRPSASAGLRFVVPFRNRTTVDLALGVSPDGWSAVRFSFIRPLQSLRPSHHTSDPIR